LKDRTHKRRRTKTRIQKMLTVVTIVMAFLILALATAFISIIKPFNKSEVAVTVQTMEKADFKKKDVYVNSDVKKRTQVNEKGELVEVDDPMDDYISIMFYGVDARNAHDIERDANGDSQILCTINKETYEVKMISFLRDTFLETPSGHKNKLTDIFSGYGVQEALGTVNMCFDLKVTDYVAVNWSALAVAVECIGGIELNLDSAEVDYINTAVSYHASVIGMPCPDPLVNVGNGTYHLNGAQVVSHCSNRTTGGLDDINRARRQRDVIYASLQKAKNCSVDTLYLLYNTVMPAIATNIDWTVILDMLLNIKQFNITETTKFPFKCTYQSDLRTAYVYCNTLVDNVVQLHALMYNDANFVPSEKVHEVSDFVLQYAAEHP